MLTFAFLLLAVSSRAASGPTGSQKTETTPAETEPTEENEAPSEEGTPGQEERQQRDQPITTLRELPELRTEKSDTFLRSDGSRAQRISGWPVNYQINGGWHPIEDQLVQSPDGTWQPEASPVPISFPASLGSGPVSVGSPSSQVSFQLQGASSGEGTPGGVVRTYHDALPSTDVAYAATPEAVRETLTLSNASAPSEYRYSLNLSPGLHAAAQPDGQIEIDNAAGRPVYWIAAPTATDASPDRPFPSQDPVHYELSDDGTTLTLVLDKAWLNDPQRVFPVTIDPEVYFKEAPACPIISNSHANSNECGSHLYVGPDSSSPKNVARSMLYFNTSSVPKGSVIVDSSLRMFLSWDTTSSPIAVEARALERSFTSGATWNKYDGTNAWTTPGGDFLKPVAGERVFNNSEVGKELHFGLSPQVEQWIRDPTSNHGILLKAKTETVAGYDAFAQAGNTEHAPEPALEVVYEPRLGTPPMGQLYQQGLANGSVMGVNVANGNLTISAPDVNFATEGYDTEFGRSYNSQDDLLEGASFGNWRANKGEDETLYQNEWDGGTDFYGPDGGDTRFDRAPWADGHPAAGDKAFTGEAGYEATLTQHESGTRSLAYGGGLEWKFDGKLWGVPTEIVDTGGEGNTLKLAYASSRLSELTDTHGHKLTITREAVAPYNITKVEAKKGEAWKYVYKEGRLITYTNSATEKTKYTYYKTTGLLESVADASGTWVIVYDEQNRVSSLRKLVNGTVKKAGSEDAIDAFSYETEQTTVTNPAGEKPIYYYDEFGNLLEEPATQEAASEAYAAYAGIEAGAAHAAVDLQDHAAILDDQLSSELGASYTGEWFAGTKVALGITSEGFERTVQQDLDNLGLADNAEIVTTPHTVAQLEEGEKSLESALKALVLNGLVIIGREASTDSATVQKANSLTSAQTNEVNTAIAAAPVPVTLSERAVAKFNIQFQSESCAHAFCPAPIRGGVSIQEHEVGNKAHGLYCTAGFIAHSDFTNQPYLLTAGHCIKYGGGVGRGWESSFPADGKKYERFIGHAAAYVSSAAGDVGMIAIDPPPGGELQGGGLQSWVVVYGSGSTTRNEHYGISGIHLNPGYVSPEHWVVCTGGAPTGQEGLAQFNEEGVLLPFEAEHCAVTEGMTNPIADLGRPEEQQLYGLEQANLCSEGGASGSPVYKWGRAYGTVVSGEKGEGKGGCATFYQGVSTAQGYLHVKIG